MHEYCKQLQLVISQAVLNRKTSYILYTALQ
jgi:hypothetical protein